MLQIGGFNLPVAHQGAARTPSTGSTAAPGPREEAMLGAGQTLQMRHVSNRPANSVRNTHIKVGHVMGHFTTRTSPRP